MKKSTLYSWLSFACFVVPAAAALSVMTGNWIAVIAGLVAIFGTIVLIALGIKLGDHAAELREKGR